MTMGVEVFLTISNLAFIIPAIVAFWYGRFFFFFVYCTVVLASGSYHLCDSFNVCLFNYNIHHQMDFIFAELTVPLTALYFVYWRDRPDNAARGVGLPWLHKIFVLFFASVTAVLVITTKGALVSQAVLFGAAALVIIGYWVIYSGIYNTLPRYEWKALAIGLCLTFISLLLFVINDVLPSVYWATHSLWHIFGALGQAYILQMKPPVPHYLNSESKIQEKIDYAATRRNRLRLSLV